MNYLEELQKITEDFNKCKDVIKSCVWDSQLTTAGTYCNNFVSYHCGRLGFFKRSKHNILYSIYDKFRGEYNIRQKIIDYIDLCVEELKWLVEDQKEVVYPYTESSKIGYGDKNIQDILRIQQEIKKWEKKKQENCTYENRKIAREKLQVD